MKKRKNKDSWIRIYVLINFSIDFAFTYNLYLASTYKLLLISFTFCCSLWLLLSFSDQIPGVRSLAWRTVARLRDNTGKPVTNLTTAIVESVGGDQMSIRHTRTHFTDRVGQGFSDLTAFSNQLCAWVEDVNACLHVCVCVCMRH